VHPYYYPWKSGFSAQLLAAKERKEHKEKTFHLCVLCVLLRLSALVAASAALRPSVVDLLRSGYIARVRFFGGLTRPIPLLSVE
jgi:hypothetical protein